MGQPTPAEGGYRVIDTDYTSYTIVYGCTDVLFGLFHIPQVWILSRLPYMTDAQRLARYATIKERLPSYNWLWFKNAHQGPWCDYSATER
jgi:hypothetical protein